MFYWTPVNAQSMVQNTEMERKYINRHKNVNFNYKMFLKSKHIIKQKIFESNLEKGKAISK